MVAVADRGDNALAAWFKTNGYRVQSGSLRDSPLVAVAGTLVGAVGFIGMSFLVLALSLILTGLRLELFQSKPVREALCGWGWSERLLNGIQLRVQLKRAGVVALVGFITAILAWSASSAYLPGIDLMPLVVGFATAVGASVILFVMAWVQIVRRA